MGLQSSKVDTEQLKDGDHIYIWKGCYSYSHHGIYVGNKNVIHHTRGPGSIISSSSPSQPSTDSVALCNIKDFAREGHKGQLYRFEYDVSKIQFVIKRAGTCSLACSCSSDEVLHRAYTLLEKGFGNYNLLGKNCEDFALYCKTGFIKGDGYLIGRSVQINSVAAASFAATIIPYRPLTIALMGGFYSFFKLGYEVEFKRKHRVRVEDLVSGHLSNADTRRSLSFGQYFGYAVFAFSIWYWFRERKTLHSFIFYHMLFNIVTDLLGFHGFNLEEYRYYAVWLLGYRYWRSERALLYWTRLLSFFSFSKIFLLDHLVQIQIKCIAYFIGELVRSVLFD